MTKDYKLIFITGIQFQVNEIFLQNVDKTDIFTYFHIYDCLYDILWNTASSPSDMNISVYYT
jgi:hypothetical protein